MLTTGKFISWCNFTNFLYKCSQIRPTVNLYVWFLSVEMVTFSKVFICVLDVRCALFILTSNCINALNYVKIRCGCATVCICCVSICHRCKNRIIIFRLSQINESTAESKTQVRPLMSMFFCILGVMP